MIAQGEVASALEVVREEELKALCLQVLERWEEALKRWDVARDVLPGSEAQECRLHMGYCEARQGAYECAVDTLDVEDRAGQSFYCRGLVLAALGREVEAAAALRSFVAGAPRRLAVVPASQAQAAAQLADLGSWARAVLLRQATEMGREVPDTVRRLRSHCETDLSLAGPQLRGLLLRALAARANEVEAGERLTLRRQGQILEEAALDADTRVSVQAILPLHAGRLLTADREVHVQCDGNILRLLEV
ncbi:MAG: hypothetical protein ACYCW6_28680 [Candidatus Xenobia bacterium]